MLPVQCMKIEDWQVQENRGNRNGYNNWCFYKQLSIGNHLEIESCNTINDRHLSSKGTFD